MLVTVTIDGEKQQLPQNASPLSLSPELLETLQALKRETALDDSQEFSYHPERMTEASLGQEPQRVTLALRTEWLNQRLQNLGNLVELQRQDIEQIKDLRGLNPEEYVTMAAYDSLISQLEYGYCIATAGDSTDAWEMRDKFIIEGTVGGAVYSQYGRILTQTDYDELKGLIQSLQSEVASLRQQVQSK